MTEDERLEARRMLQAATDRIALLKKKGESVKAGFDRITRMSPDEWAKATESEGSQLASEGIQLISEMRSYDSEYSELEELIGKIRARLEVDEPEPKEERYARLKARRAALRASEPGPETEAEREMPSPPPLQLRIPDDDEPL